MNHVDLIVNVYNGDKYLFDTLQSLVDQDYKKLRIHCVDNHSTDNTVNIINDFRSKHNNLYYYKTPTHIPLVDARLFAISKILIPLDNLYYFGFCDADDLWEKKWVSSLMKYSDNNYDILVCNGYTLEGEKKIPCRSCLSMARKSPFNCPIYIQSCLFHSKLIQNEEALFNTKFQIAYDTEFWLNKGCKLSYLHISDHLFCYRIHSNSMGKTNFVPLLRERWRMMRLHKLSIILFGYGFFRQVINKLKFKL